MLLDVAALSTSVALSPVAEAFSAQEIAVMSITVVQIQDVSSFLPDTDHGAGGVLSWISQTASSLVTTVTPTVSVAVPPVATVSAASPAVSSVPSVANPPLPDAPLLPLVGPEPAASSTDVLYGSRLLEQISLLPASQVGSFIRSNSDALDGLIEAPLPAREITLWWNALTGPSRAALLREAPAVMGNLEGIPYQVRDVANRTLLDSTMQELDQKIARENGRTIVERAQQQLTMLKSISDALSTTKSSEAPRTLLTLDVEGQGRAAIVVGDLATADYISYMVPGMFFTVSGQMTYWTDAAARLRDEQLNWLALFGEPDSGVATVAWIGYHTPNLTNVGNIDSAVEGSHYLAETIEGVQASRTADEPYVTVIAHSYGSTAALIALADDDFSVDALAVVGSPGSPAQSVKDLHVKNGNVYVGEAPFDPVPHTAFFGSDPGAPSYGATLFGTAGGTDSITGKKLLKSFFHIEYFSPGTESLRNLSLIGIGHGDDITPG